MRACLAALGLAALVGCGTTRSLGATGSGGASGETGGSKSSSSTASSAGATSSSGAGGAASTSSSSSGTSTSSTTGTSTSTTSSSTSASSGGPCPTCIVGLKCCKGVCVNEMNDIHNCGGCNIACAGANPYCNNGVCGTPPCNGAACPASEFCCGTQCCMQGMLCCSVPGPVVMPGPTCNAPVNGTCPVGCPLCP
jgi:hypothetical protein